MSEIADTGPGDATVDREEPHRLLLDGIRDYAIIALDQNGRITDWNTGATLLFGCPRAEALGQPFARFFPPEARERGDPERQLRIARSRGQASDEVWLIRKDGTAFRASGVTTALRDSRGRLLGFAKVLHRADEAAARRAREETARRAQAEEAERRLTAILEGTPDFVATFDPEGRIFYLNQAGRRMLGIAPDEDVSKIRMTDIHSEAVVAKILQQAIPTVLREGSWRGETSLRSRDGREIPVSQVILAHRNPQGEVEFLSTIAHDIGERKRNEENLRFLAEASQALVAPLDFEATSERLARLIVPRLADFCTIDVRQNSEVRRVAAVHSDPEKEEILGKISSYPPDPTRPVGVDAVIRKGEPELVPHVSVAWLRAASRDDEHFEALRELDPKSLIIVPLQARGQTFGAMVLGSAQPGRFTPADLELAGELARRAALAMNNARLYQDARHATHIRDQVLRIVAHDLRNPLNTISLSAGLLLESLPEQLAKERDQLALIQRSVDRANRLIRDLLDVARIEARGIAVDRAPHDAAALVREAAELHRPLAEEKGLQLEVHLPEDLPAVYVDRDRVLQVLGNLLGNAIEFTPRGGRITVRAERLDGQVRCSVSDTGPGIPEDQLPHIFEPFWQATKRTGEGAGLGLTIARAIIQAHGGQIWAESKPGAGTTFYFTLPTTDATGRPSSSPPAT